MKKVGILLRKDETYHLNRELVEWLLKYNIIPIGLVSDNLEQMITASKLCDGIILQGGLDYTNEEIEFVKYLYDNNLPTLGICLGMQMMAVALHGKMSRLNTLEHKSTKKYVHLVKISENSKLYKITKEGKLLVNSRHQDIIEYTDLDIVAKSTDDVIEAVEAPNKTFFLGVQWHPESLQDSPSSRILESFIASL